MTLRISAECIQYCYELHACINKLVATVLLANIDLETYGAPSKKLSSDVEKTLRNTRNCVQLTAYFRQCYSFMQIVYLQISRLADEPLLDELLRVLAEAQEELAVRLQLVYCVHLNI